MKFKNVAEAFNHYMTASVKEIEQRAAEIGREIDTNANADLASLNIELEGLKQAKANAEQRNQPVGFNPVTGTSFDNRASYEATEGDVFASAEYRSAFYKTLLGHSLSATENAAYKRAQEIMLQEKRADAFASASNAAAVLPTLTLNEIVSKARTQGGLLSVARGFNLPAKLSVPVATPSGAASWHTEGAAVETEAPDVASVAFDGYEIIKIFSISAKVRRMSVPAFEQYLIEELNAAVMGAVESGLVSGTGTNQGSGLETITWTAGTNLVEYASGTKPGYTDFVDAIAKLKRGYSAGAYWAMNNATLYTHVYGVMDTSKRPIFTPDPRQELIGHILGKPVVIDDNIADGVIYIGNFNYLGYNFAEAPIIEVSRDSSFNKGLIDYRALAIADTKPIVAEAFVKLAEGA